MATIHRLHRYYPSEECAAALLLLIQSAQALVAESDDYLESVVLEDAAGAKLTAMELMRLTVRMLLDKLHGMGGP